MGRVTAGSRYWIPMEAFRSSTEGVPHLSFRTADDRELDLLYGDDLGQVPDHPALPILARWLERYPDGMERLARMALGQIARVRPSTDDRHAVSDLYTELRNADALRPPLTLEQAACGVR